MSLQVWLPLTDGTLKQQGLKNISATIGGTVGLTDAGKLGKCATIGTAAGGITLPASAMTSFTECSVAFWINITSWNTDWDTIFQAGLGSTPWNNYIFGILRNQGNYLCFTVSNGSSTSSGSYASSNLTIGQWMHLTFTYGNGKCKIYINGILDKEYSTSITPNFAGITHIAIGRSTNSSYKSKCKLNDFRIYDHCLSPMEVKELAKGLVLHYPLNRQGWGQDNLLPGSYRADGNTTNKIYGWQANGNGTPEIIKVDNIDCIHLQANCTGKYIPSIVSASKVFLEYGVEYTISCDLKFDKDITVTNSTPIHYHSGSSSSTDEFNTANINNGHGFNFKSISPAAGTTIPANTWQHYEQHIIAKTAPTDSSLPYLTYRAFIYGSVRTISETVSVNMWLKNWKIEKGSIATPWCPNSSDALATTMGLNSITEYDCSGFCNNGSKGGSTISYTSDTPKYAVSTQLIGTTVDTSSNTKTGAAYITGPCSLSNITALTVTWWAKIRKYGRGGIMDLTSWTSNYEEGTDYNTCPLSNWDSTFRLWDGTNAFNFFSYVLKDSTWHHYAVTFTSGSGKFYRDGANIASSGTMGNTLTNFNGIRTGLGKAGGVYRQIDEDVSDLRIYATALSADDVKSLYQNSAYIDSSGNVYGAVHSEA